MQTESEVGVLAYQLHLEADNPDAFIVYERWRSLDALEAHLRTPYPSGSDFGRRPRSGRLAFVKRRVDDAFQRAREACGAVTDQPAGPTVVCRSAARRSRSGKLGRGMPTVAEGASLRSPTRDEERRARHSGQQPARPLAARQPLWPLPS